MKLRENAVYRQAEKLGGWSYLVGMNAGPIDMLIRGGFMLKNASNESYATVGSNIISAAHQVSLDKLSQNTGFWGETLEVLYQGGYAIIDMVPVMGLSMIPYVGPALSSAYLYAKSFATTYDSKIREGKRADEALTGAVLTATAEVVLERVLSGIGKVGGARSLSNRLSAAIDNLAVTHGMKMALKWGGKVGSEGFEEFLQDVLSPFISKIAAEVNGITDAEWEEIDWEEAGKSFLIGALTGGVLGSADVATEYRMRKREDVRSRRALELESIGKNNDVTKVIKTAADLGNKRAQTIMNAIKNKSPLYEGKTGLFSYASPADVTNMRISIRRNSKRLVMDRVRNALENAQGRDHSNDEQILGIFEALLGNRKIDVKQMAILLNDEVAVKLLNRMTGENIAALMPNDAMYLARLTAFVDANGKIDKARLDAFRDAFGDLDFKAIEQILKYEDLVGAEIAKGNLAGVIFEDTAVEETLTEEEKEAVEELKVLSDMTGTFYLITDAFETGTYVSDGLMTIRREDLSKGAYYAMGREAYYMTMQLDPERGNVIKEFLLKEIEERIGAEGIEAKKADLRKRGTEEDLLDDELCAEMMPAVFLQGNYKAAEDLAARDVEAAENLRKVIGSIREHLAEEYAERVSAPEAVEATGRVRFEKGVKATSRRQRLAVAYAKHLASAIGIDIVFYDSTIPGTFGADANGYFYSADNSIHLDLQKVEAGKGTVLFTLSHELVHFAQKFSAEKYQILADFLVENYGTDTMEQLIQNKMKQLKTDDRDFAKSEVIADACERMLIDSDAMIKLQALKERDAGLWETIKEHIRNLMEKVRAMFANVSPTTPEGIALQEMTDVLEQAKAMFEDMVVDAAQNFQVAQVLETEPVSVFEDGTVEVVKENGYESSLEIKKQAKKSKIDPTLLDPRTVTETDVRNLLEDAQNGVLSDSSYIPLRKDTPQFFIGVVKEHSKGTHFVADYPMAATVEHLRQNMEEVDGQSYGKKRPHELSVDDIVTISEKIGDPSYIVLQKNNRYALVVSFYNKQKKNVVVSISFANDTVGKEKNFKHSQYMNGYEGGYYNVVVTQYEPDSLRKYLDNNEVVYDKKEMNGRYQVGSGRIVTVTHDTPFIEDTVAQNDSKVKFLNQKKQNNFSTKTFSEAMVDTVSQETTELYDRLTEALKKHYGIQQAVSTDFDSSADFEGSSFVYTDSDTARKKIEAKIERFQKENELTPDEIEYCKKVANGGPIVEVQDPAKAEIYDELIRMYMDLDVPESSLEYGQPRFDDMTQEEREEWFGDRQKDIDGYIEALVDYGEPISKAETPKPEDSVMTEIFGNKEPVGKKLKKAWNWWRRKWTDSGATVYDIAKEIEDPTIYHAYNAAGASMNGAIYMVLGEQTDIYGKTTGKSLKEIFKPILDRGTIYYRDFQLYLLHMHNIDRMSRESERAKEQADTEFQIVVEACPELSKYTDNEIRRLAFTADGELQQMAQVYVEALKNKEYWSSVKNAPVFGEHVTAADSRLGAQMLLEKYPEFKQTAEEIYKYSRNLLQYRVDSGLITKEFAEKLQQIYPHYVPTARAESSVDSSKIKGIRTDKVQIGNVIRSAVGGSTKIIPLHKQLADQTMAVVREGGKNRFGARLLKIALKKELSQVKRVEKVTDRILPVVTFEGQINMVDPFVTDEFENVFTVYLDGEQYNMEVTEDLFEAIQALAPDKEATNMLTKFGRGSVDIYKKLITAYNPAFAIRNFARDMQDALFYTKDLEGFISNFLPAIREIKENGELWRQYQALGGTYSSIYNFATGMEEQRGKFSKVLGRVETLNMMIEQLPRFAEFMATVKKGDGSMESLMEAMYNAAEITTNFGRSGTIGKVLNRSFVPFFNPGVQGFSAAVRKLTETKGARAWGALILKAAALGVVPSLLNGLLWGDDDEWEIINQRDKDVNYLFKVGDGLWVKIPKGRVLSVLGMTVDRVLQVVGGEEVEWGEYIEMVGDQIAPANPLTANVLAGIMSVGYNKTWYGGDIVSASMQNLPKAEQYDAQTDIISVWLGNLLNQSPKKINYILDQYTGVAGDVILPALSVAEERGFWAKAFTIDSDYSNRLSGDFYDRLQELTEKKNSVNGTVNDEVKYRWWNKKAGELSEVNKEIKAVQADTALTREEKQEKLDVLYASRNALILAAEDDYEKYILTVDEVAKGVDLADEDAADTVYREVNRKMFGAETAIMMYSNAAYARALEVQKEKGIDFDTFYDVYFDDTVSNDQTFDLIEGGMSKKSAMVISREIQALDPEPGKESVSYLQKYKAINGADVSSNEKLKAMDVLASEADRRRVKIGDEYDVSMDLFVKVKENIEHLNDLDGKTSASNSRIEAGIRHEDGLTNRQRAVLWQLFSSSDSAKNNPFSASIGWEIVAKVKAYKAAEE